MRWLSAIILLLICGRPLQAQPADLASNEKVRQRLSQLMQTEVAQHHFSGAVLIARDGRVLLAKGYGFANLEWGVPNSPATKFRIGSLTKQFTATAIVQLRDKGLVNLQDSICKYLQPCATAWRPVTLHHLLSNTAGISGYGPAPDPTAHSSPPWTTQQIFEAFQDRELEFQPGTKWKYSDWGYCLLGLVIEKVTGQSYESVLREQIFAPLGMNDSGYDHSEIALKNRASGYRLAEGTLQNAEYINMLGPYAAGGLYSTVEDLLKWDQALYSNAVLSQGALRLMWTEVMNHYGYGWIVVDALPKSKTPPWAVPGHVQLVHPGSINGFTSELLRFPNEHATVIVLANLENAHPIGSALGVLALAERAAAN
jgi:CubicO group peptidase (beta-lactamase class C family)